MRRMSKIQVEIDGKEVEADDGMTILEAARNAGIRIPALCHHEELKPYGACRLCLVEIETHGKKGLVASCLYPVEDRLVVKTQSEKVLKIRMMLIAMLLALAPESRILQDLAREYDIRQIPFEQEPSFCVLCGLCVRYCNEVKKKNAVGFIGRGTGREINFIPEIGLKECPQCKECFPLCPTSALQAQFVLTQGLVSHKP